MRRTNLFDSSCKRLWIGPSDGLQVRLFRRVFDVSSHASAARLKVYAERRFHVWLNGHYLGRGPTFHHPFELPVDEYLIEAGKLRVGRNVLAVLVQSPGATMHNHVPNGKPGLVAQLTVDGSEAIVSDDSWRVTDRTGWRSNTPRRNWAIDHVEQFDMAEAPAGWQQVEFDDRSWMTPESHPIDDENFRPRPVPMLRYERVNPLRCSQFRIDAAPIDDADLNSSNTLGRSIMDAPWTPIEAEREWRGGVQPIASGTVLCLDLGREYTGQVIVECDSPGRGTIDVGWSEVAENGRPLLVRKGVGYVDRIHASKRRLKWHPIQFSGMRYVAIVFRGFDAPVTLRDVHLLASEPDVSWASPFRSSDAQLDAIFDLCTWSHRVGTQETQMDCPSREQAAYVGDGMLTARWYAQFTGDLRHWTYLVRAQFQRQAENGLLRSSIFSGSNQTIMDYSPLALIGLRDYHRFTGDTAIVRELIDHCRKIVGFFNKFRDDRGLCTWRYEQKNLPHPWEAIYDPAQPKFADDGLILFIDHPGMGWHNKNEAGIDRRGMNAALGALTVLMLDAMADLEAVVSDQSRANELRAQAEQTRQAVRETFFDRSRGVFSDGLFEDRLLEQISEQTNTFAIAARCCDDDTARLILKKLLTSDDPKIARNGPYFWSYLLPELHRLGLHELAIEKVRTLWGGMLRGGATALWETFLGDDLDTWCHPWSGAPAEFLLTRVLGLPGLDMTSDAIVLCPRWDLLSTARGSIWTTSGRFDIEWSAANGTVQLRGVVPMGVNVSVQSPTGAIVGEVHGIWRLEVV